ncbi:MAG: glycine--tRNA ligase [Verrucomicrobia bacterium TMED44]|nr:MAG: glycine--tRNA ligase [Verrucomicrobia bacterium TMED44]
MSKENSLLEEIVALAKRRGFVFQSSEIYGGLNGFFDYGPLGVELRKNIKDAWWEDMVRRREDVVGLDSGIIMNPKVWQASGHIDGFTDPMVDCKESKMRYRADQLFASEVIVDGDSLGWISLIESEIMQSDAEGMAEAMKRKAAKQGKMEEIILKPYDELSENEQVLVPSPATGKVGSLTPPRDFNMMFETHVGALRDGSSLSYLRPETAQGIFANFKNVVDTGRVKVPFGIAQIGKAFRNEITPRNFIFRSREFEQMEIEYFIPPGEEEWRKYHEEWINTRRNWFSSIGLTSDCLGEEVHPQHKLAHYARACTDITFKFPFGEHELEGIAARGNFDLSQHQEHSGKNLEYFDEERKEKYLPHVIEPSLGVDRTFLAVLCSAYTIDEVEGEKRTVLKFHPRVAPIKVGIFPLVKNKPALVDRAKEIYKMMQRRWNVIYDQSGAIGRRYRRIDEAGVPFGLTVDFDTIEGDGSVTLRNRDTTEQKRVSVEEAVVQIAGEVNP